MICFGRIGLAILLLGACFTAVSGQYLCVRHLDRENVLPTQSINDVDNDPSGVLWLATNTGLFHYDGMQCERIPLYSLLDSHYLYQVNRVMTDQHGVTYLAFLNNGLGVLEKGLPLRHYKKNRKDDSGLPNNSIDYLLDLGENVLLIFEQNGFALFHKKSGRFTHLLPSSYFPHADTIARIDLLYKAVSDPEHPGDAWLSGAMGLFHWDHRRRQLFHYPLAPGISSLAPARAIYLHRDQKLYLGGFGKGLHIFNIRTKRWELRIERRDGLDISIIACIAARSERELWLSTYHEGLCAYDLPTGKCTRLLPYPKEAGALIDAQRMTDAEIMKMVPLDTQSWCLLKVGDRGLAFLHREQQIFRKYQTGVDMHKPFKGPSGETYLITNQPYVFIFSPETTEHKRIEIIPFQGDGGFRDGFTSGDGTCYVAGWKGLYRFRPGDRTARHVPMPLLDSLVRQKIEILTALYDDRGSIWLGTRRGIYLATGAELRRERWLTFADTLDGRPVPWTWFRDIHMTPDGKIWFAGDQGIGMSPDGGKSFQLYRQANFQNAGIGMADFSTLAHDRFGRLWVGSSGEGLGYFKWSSSSIGAFHPLLQTPFRQLPNAISNLTCDRQGMIWGIHQGGLFRMDTRDLSIQTFGKEFGLPESKLYTLDTFPGGYLHIGSDKGYFLFQPETLNAVVQTSRIIFREAHFLGREQPDTLEQPKALLLRYPQNGLHVQVAVQPYWLNTRLKLRYRFYDGSNAGWRYTEDPAGLTFWNISPGQSILQVQAANGLGIFSPGAETSILLQVRAAWWNNWWFRIGVLLVISGVLAGAWYQKQRSIRADLQFKKRLVELELAGLRAQINPHFIFNSLNAVKWQVVNGDRRKAEEYLDRFSTLVRRSLDYSAQNLISLEDEIDFLRQYVEMEQIRFQDTFIFKLELPQTDEWMLVQVPPMSLQPYVENAIRHGLLPKETGDRALVVGVQFDEGDCLLVIRDNGIGRAAAQEAQARTGAIRPSFGMQISSDRFRILSESVFQDFHIQVTDLYDDDGQSAGTELQLSFRYTG